MLTDYQTLVTSFVRDDATRITPGELDGAIGLAVLKYSAAAPRPRVADLTNVSGMVIALPAAWEADFSAMTSLEHPVGSVPPVLLDGDAWAFYRDIDGLKIMLAASLPAGSTVRATFTARHAVSATEDTIPVGHREPVAKYAAALLCEQLAAFYANDTDSTIAAGMAQGQTKSQAYAARARDYRKAYIDAIGVEDKSAQPACAVAGLKTRDSDGQSRFFHPRHRQ
ncbi:MAG: hypothetical protein Q7U97_13865 [Rhodocyclaceae bacterium]|nr:hypothetical protein [Rhodocyclaceae bacterium]